MRWLVVCLLSTIALVSEGLAQSFNPDSLRKALNIQVTDTTRISVLNTLAYDLREIDQDKALVYATQAKVLCEKIHFNQGLPYALDNIAWIFYRKGIYDKAFENASHALSICEINGNEFLGARCMGTLAAIYLEQKKFKLVFSTFEKILAISEKLKDERNVIRSLNNIAYVYSLRDSLEKAIDYSNKALTKAEKFGEKYLIAFNMRTIGDINYKQYDYEKALEYFNNSIELSEKIKNTFLITSLLHRIGNVYVKLGKNEQANQFYLRNIDLCKKYGYGEELEQTYKFLAESYIIRKNYKMAYEYLNLHVALHDSLFSYLNAQQLAIFQNDYENKIKQNDLKLLKKETSLKAKTIFQQEIIIYSALAGAVMLSIVVFLLTYNNRQKQAINDLLLKQKDEITSEAGQLKEIDNVKNKLFSILAHDLRSSFHSIQGLLNLLEDDLTKDEMFTIGHHLKQSVSYTNSMLDNILNWAKSQLQGSFTKKERITLKDFANSKINFLKNSASIKHINIINNIPEGLNVYADSDQLDLIIRNLISNAIKFTPSLGSIIISATEKNGTVEVGIKDTGIGLTEDYKNRIFKADTYITTKGTSGEKGTGLGLVLVKEFVEKNGGNIWVESQPHKGSTFTFSLKTASGN